MKGESRARLNCRIPAELKRRLVTAEEKSTTHSMTDMVVAALEEYLDQLVKKAKK